MTFQTLLDTTDARDVTFSRPTTNPHALVGVIVLWLRDEGLIPNATPYSDEAARRRVELAREMLAAFGVDAVTAVERAGRHAVVQAVAA
jgi:hypothetical protein